jgi:ketosteroid isomerase-like protein
VTAFFFQRRVDAWLAADLDAYMDCWAEDMVITLPTGEIRGRDRYRKLVAGGFAWATPVSFDVHHLGFDGPVALADWTIRARRTEDSALIEWRGLSVCEFRDDKIIWWREHHLAPPGDVRPGEPEEEA